MRPKHLSTYTRLRRIARNPWRTARFEASQPSGKVHVVQLNGGPYLYLRAGRGDFDAFERVFLDDVYRLGRPPAGGFGAVIDVGAHVGMFSARISRSADRVLCYEPCVETFTCLARNVAACLNVEAVCAAVAPTTGSIPLFRPSDERHSDRAAPYPDASAGLSTEYDVVPAVSLEQIFEEHRVRECSLLRLDAGGLEYELIYGLTKPVLDRIERIYVDCHDLSRRDRRLSAKPLATYLGSLGFSVDIVPRALGAPAGRVFAERR